MRDTKHVNERAPNFYVDGKLYLVRCFACGGERGLENHAIDVSSGTCYACGWNEKAAAKAAAKDAEIARLRERCRVLMAEVEASRNLVNDKGYTYNRNQVRQVSVPIAQRALKEARAATDAAFPGGMTG